MLYRILYMLLCIVACNNPFACPYYNIQRSPPHTSCYSTLVHRRRNLNHFPTRVHSNLPVLFSGLQCPTQPLQPANRLARGHDGHRRPELQNRPISMVLPLRHGYNILLCWYIYILGNIYHLNEGSF